VKLYDNSWAVLIGIGTYEDPIFKTQNLPTVINDVNKIKEILIKYCDFKNENIKIISDRDATSNKIRNYFDRELADKVEVNDRVLIFYSGHGMTRGPHGREPERGYMVTHDIKHEAGDYDWQSVIQLDEFVPFVQRKLKAKQIFFMFDCCFSGLVHQPPEYEGQRENLCPEDMKAACLKQSVQIYSAASKDEVVLASAGVHPPISVFVESIARTLCGASPRDYPENFISAFKLSKEVTMLVRETSISLSQAQNPQYYFSTLDQQGEFVLRQFSQDEIDNSKKEPGITYEPIENLIKNSELHFVFVPDNLVKFKRYLEQNYKNGYSLQQLKNSIYKIIKSHEQIKSAIDNLTKPEAIGDEEIIQYVSENIVAMGISRGIFRPKLIEYIQDISDENNGDTSS